MKILFIAGTNFELYITSSMAYLLRQKDPRIECTLLLRDVYQKNMTPEIERLYGEIQLFKIPSLTFVLSKNPVRLLRNIFENLYQTFYFKRFIARTLSHVDVVCVGGFREFFANVMCRNSPSSVRLVAFRLADQKLDEEIRFRTRPLLSFLLNIKNILFGYSSLEYKWNADGRLELVSKNYRKYPYHATISLTDHDIGRRDSFFRLPPPFIALKELYRTQDAIPTILVAGDKTPVYEGWDDEDQKKYEAFLDFLRTHFPDYRLLFKPKMGKTDPTKYRLEKFEIVSPESSLEEVCLRNNVKKVIAIRSTSAKVGAYFGIPSYLLYTMFKPPAELKEIVGNYFEDMQSVIHVRKVEDLETISSHSINRYSTGELSNLYWDAIIS